MDLRKEFIAIFLGQNDSLLHPSFLTLHPQVSVSTQCKSFPLEYMEIITESHSWTQCRDQRIVGTSAQTTAHLLHLWLKEHLEEGEETRNSAVKWSLLEIPA